MRPIARSGSAAGSEPVLARLRGELQPALDALDRAAAHSGALAELADDLPALQYALHVAAERTLGSAGGGSDDDAFGELECALSAAREETAAVAEALAEEGPAAAAPLLWEWRAALFGVRLALLRLDACESEAVEERAPEALSSPILLLGAGIGLVLGGALAETWPVWILGLVLVAASTARTRLP